MYSTMKVPASLDASLVAAGEPGVVDHGSIDPVLCTSVWADIGNGIYVVTAPASVSEPVVMPSVNTDEMTRHSSVEQLISAL